MGLRCFIALLTLSLVSIPVTVRGDDQAVTPLHVRIDALIDHALTDKGISPSPRASDSQYLRRVTLDLAGRVPTANEVRAYLDDTDPLKHERLVDRLLDTPDFSFHQRNELDILLLARLQWNNEWRNFLLQATRENRPWNQLVREILLPEKHRVEDKGAVAFLKQRANDLDAMTNDTSSLLFGVNIACAKCHDHPLTPDWHQDHYFGFASFFKRTFATRRGFLAERFDGELKFTTTEGEERKATFMFLNGRSTEETLVSRTDQEWTDIREKLRQAEQNDKAEPPPAPPFSPREQLLSLALDGSQTSLLAKNFANRLWARLMGRGLIHPLDQIHSGNPPSHPELLDALTQALLDHEYDARHLLREIALSNAYARSSQPYESTDPIAPEWFAAQQPRPLTPLQYSLSLHLVTRNPEKLPGIEKPDTWNAQREQWEQRSEGFARKLEIPEEHFQISIEEALMFSNQEQIERDFLQTNQESLVGHLLSLPNINDRIDAAFFTILSRQPTNDERTEVHDFLTAREDRQEKALKQIVWAILTSAEFRFNH